MGKRKNQRLRKMLLYIEYVTFCLKKELGIMPSEKPEQPATDVKPERMMAWFEFAHLPPHLQVVSVKFYELACSLCAIVEPGPERTVALRKLLEAKDAAVRATITPGG